MEYYYGVYITKKSPLMKRLNQQEHLKKFIETDVKNMEGAVGSAIGKAFKR